MNLSAYDVILRTTDKSKTWIDTAKRKLLSRELKYRKYYTFLKRYNPKYNTNSYYIAITDTNIINCRMFCTYVDNYGRIKLNVASIFNDSSLCDLENQSNIDVNLVEEQDDGEIYEICV